MRYGAIVIGAGPAGMAAALGIDKSLKVLVIERENRTGGILKQCVHDGFGVLRFNEKLSGPEYSGRFIDKLYANSNIEILTSAFVTHLVKKDGDFFATITTKCGIKEVSAPYLVLANGCRERTPRQVNIHGTRPAGLLTAGAAQHYVNLMGALPGKRCLILGSGDIGLIMARRLHLEGAEVLGVYEAKPCPSGLSRNLQQCLYDFDIPLYLSKTVNRVFGDKRVTAAEIMSVDGQMNPVGGTEEIIECDSVIVSVGLIPENELAEGLEIPIDPKTKGPYVDQHMMTLIDGAYGVGNALHVHDLVDYVSEGAEYAGRSAGKLKDRMLIKAESRGFLYMVPQYIDVNNLEDETVFYFRSDREYEKATVRAYVNGKEIFSKRYTYLKPPEMERFTLKLDVKKEDVVSLTLEGENG